MSRIKRRNGARERRTEVKWRKTADKVASKEEEEEEKVQSNQPSSSCWSTRQMMPRWSDAVTQFFPPCSTSSTWTPSAATALADIDGWWMSTATSNAVVPLADIDDWWTPTSSAVVAEPSTVYALGCFGEYALGKGGEMLSQCLGETFWEEMRGKEMKEKQESAADKYLRNLSQQMVEDLIE
eukprot:GHVS01077506.1.p1 GENE.GHVS01077506.1~~GHVS01077506.1.p1  ORF type:complete len:182 (+),score=37.99 GHVS01077506.1:202-747(+)